MTKALGVFTAFAALDSFEQQAVRRAVMNADNSANHGLCFKSDFPVGSAIYAANARGELSFFDGSNVENERFPSTICAERTAASRSAFMGFKDFRIAAVFCRKFPGGSPCGLCRQMLVQFGREATLLNVVDHDKNVRKALVGDLLPAASEAPLAYDLLNAHDQKVVDRVLRLKKRSHVPYSKKPQAALFIATHEKRGKERIFEGVADDNASYGGSALAESVAMRTARTAGYSSDVMLVATVDDLTAVNPIDGECLQVLREFGANADIVLVGPDKSVVRTTLDELLPDSFGPEAL